MSENDANFEGAFWADLERVVRACQNSSGRERNDAWALLGLKLRDWTRVFAHRKGVYRPADKDEFCSFMLGWLALPGRLSSFDSSKGRFFAWHLRALEKGYSEYWRERASKAISLDQTRDASRIEAPLSMDEIVRDAQEELAKLPVSLRTAFKIIHHSLLGPLEESEINEFVNLFGINYEDVRGQLDQKSLIDAALFLGKSADWAYQVKHRALVRLREDRDEQ